VCNILVSACETVRLQKSFVHDNIWSGMSSSSCWWCACTYIGNAVGYSDFFFLSFFSLLFWKSVSTFCKKLNLSFSFFFYQFWPLFFLLLFLLILMLFLFLFLNFINWHFISFSFLSNLVLVLVIVFFFLCFTLLLLFFQLHPLTFYFI
jgi:hypothetical protein